MTNVGRLCDSFMEAAWLVAVVLVAVFLNPFSDQVFEPDKVALFRGLVLLMATAWVIRALDDESPATLSASDKLEVRGRFGHAIERLRKNPIVAAAGLWLVVNLASTGTSVSPRVSWWGSYQRAQGAYTLLAYLGFFLAVSSALRREGQLRRLVTILLVASFPVALYAVLQHYGMSLLQFSAGGIETRVISTLGNAIFLAAYLGMVVPLTLVRLVASVRARSEDPSTALAGVLLYSALLVLQLVAIIFTQSRGPVLGLLVELFIFVLLLSLLRRQRAWALVGVGLVAGAITLLLLTNLLGLSSESVRGLRYVERFVELAGAGAQSIQARALAWDTILDAMRAEPARFLLGYGADTMKSVLTQFMPADLWVLQGGGLYGTFDRAHNALFDALYAQGVIGAVTYLLLYGTIFVQALRWLGLAGSRRHVRVLIGLQAGGAFLGLIAPWLWRGSWSLAAVGVPFGLLAGLVLYLLGHVVGQLEMEPVEVRHPILAAALLSAVAGHFVETQTGIQVVATQSHVWLYMALLVALGTGQIAAEEPAQNHTQPKGRSRFRRGRRDRRADDGNGLSLLAGDARSVVVMALVVAALLGALSYAFVHGFNVPGARRPAQILISVTWLFAMLMILLASYWRKAEAHSLNSDVIVYVIASVGWVLPYALFHRLTARTLDRLDTAYLVFVVWILLTLLAIAAVLHTGRRVPRSTTPLGQLMLYGMIVLVSLALTWRLDVTRIRADVYEKVGKTAMGAGLWDQAIPNLRKAVLLRPWQDQYYIFLGGAYVEQARLLSEPAARDEQMSAALRILEQGRALAPRDSDHLRQLGLAYRIWAEWASDEGTRRERLQQSRDYYADAVALNPQNPDLSLDLADAFFALGMNDGAFSQYQRAIKIGSPNHVGRAYAGLGDVHVVQGEPELALQAYQQAMQAGRDRQEVIDERVRAVSRHPDNVRVHVTLSLAYAAADRPAYALRELNTASELVATAAERALVERARTLVGE